MPVRVIKGIKEFESLAVGWDDLLDSFPYRDLCYSFEWYANWLRSFADERHLRIVAVEDADRLLSVLPLYEDRIRYSNISLRVVKSLTNFHSHRFDMLARADGGELLAQTVAAAFAAGRQQVMVLDYVPADSYLMKWLADVSQEMNWHYFISDFCTNCLVRPINSFDEFYGSLDGKFRKNVNAAWRKATSRGGMALHSLSRAEDIDAFLGRGFALEASGWKGNNGSAIASNASTRQFYEGIARDFHRRGWMKAYLLENGGDDLAFYYCIAGYNAIRALKIGVNDQLRHLGPGMLITKEVLAALHDAGGFDVWDFCGGEARWKRDWANDSETLWRVVICNDSFIGKTLYKLHSLNKRIKEFKQTKDSSAK